MSACDTCVVRNRAICASLDSNELETLNTIGRRRILAPGESLIWEGEDSVLVANVIDGVLKLSTGTEDGREQAHPVFCLLRSALAESLIAFLNQGGRKIDAWFAQHKAVAVRFADPGAFFNANTIAELAQLQPR